MPSIKQECKLPTGDTVELFYIGALAKALGRTPTLVRMWENKGIIPEPCFRDSKGRRLYSQEQIDLIKDCMINCGIRRGVSIEETSFSHDVFEGLEKLEKKYKGE